MFACLHRSEPQQLFVSVMDAGVTHCVRCPHCPVCVGLSPKVTTTTPTGAKCLAKLEATRRFDHISTELPQHTAEQVARKQAQRRVALLDGHEGGVVCLACSHFQVRVCVWVCVSGCSLDSKPVCAYMRTGVRRGNLMQVIREFIANWLYHETPWMHQHVTCLLSADCQWW